MEIIRGFTRILEMNIKEKKECGEKKTENL
jgi:hypothetical protein